MFSIDVDARTKIELFQLQDKEALYALIDRNREHLRKWLLWVDKRTSPSDFDEIIPAWAMEYAKTGSFDAGIRYDGTLVGMFGMQINRRDRIVHLSYFLDAWHQGKGIVSSCVKKLVNYSFSTLGMNKVEIQVAANNTKSRAIPERLNFVLERTTRDGQWLYDHYEDIVSYSLLKSELEPAAH